MNSYLVSTILSYTIAPATVLAVYFFRQRRFTYLPFLLLLVGATLNEVVSTVVIYQKMSNAVNSNIYVLAECLLLIWLFAQWEPDLSKGRRYYCTAVLFTCIWIGDNIVFNSIYTFNPFFRIAYSVLIVIMSSDHLSYLLTNNCFSPWNSRSMLCIMFLVKYCYKVFTQLFVAFDPGYSNAFYEVFFFVWIIINTLSNIVFLMVVLWMSRKERYYIFYS
jgi:hypothetical protein